MRAASSESRGRVCPLQEGTVARGWVLASGRRAEVGLADAGVVDEHHLEEVIVLVLRPVPTSIGSHCFPSPPQKVRPPLVSLGQGGRG